MCVKCKIWLKNTKIQNFHLGYCFLIWASSLKISVAQLAIVHKKLIWDPARPGHTPSPMRDDGRPSSADARNREEQVCCSSNILHSAIGSDLTMH